MMQIELSDEAREFGHHVHRALEANGETEGALDALGIWDLDVRGDADELEAAAAACRAAGWWAVPYPVAERLVEPSGDDAVGLVLQSWTLLGMLDRAMALTVQYVQERQQFGQPLAGFQGVQFQLTDAEVERAGVEELAKYALWSVQTGRPEALDDALALRLAALEGAEIVFRVCHQLHGAIGFCDETTLSWVSRRSQAIRRAPLGLSPTRAALLRRIDGGTGRGAPVAQQNAKIVLAAQELMYVELWHGASLSLVWTTVIASRQT